MTKKQEKIDADKSAIRQRVYDMLRGASGGYSLDRMDEDGLDIPCVVSVEIYGRWLKAIESELCSSLEAEWYKTIKVDELSKFETLDKAADTLYKRGVRP